MANTTKKKSGCLGCSIPVIIIAIVLVVVALVGGNLGYKFLEGNPISPIIGTPKPEVHLPAHALFYIGGFPVTNTLITSWITVITLVLVCWLTTRRMKIVPTGFQKVFEFGLGWMWDFCKGIVGDAKARKYFPLFATIFLYIMFNAWWALVPGFGDAFYVQVGVGEEAIRYPLLRAANTDMNLPLALAVVSFLYVEFEGIRSLGFKYFTKFLNFGRLFKGFGELFRGKVKSAIGNILFGFINVFIGVIEALTEIMRLVSLTFRLWGNMTAGEIVILIMFFLVPFVIPDIFYGLESLIGLIQALVFGGLTLIYISLAIEPHAEEEHAEH